MSVSDDARLYVHSIGTIPGASLPERGLDPALSASKHLRIALRSAPSRAGVFEVTARREGASGTNIYLQPGQLGLKWDERVEVSASPVGRWAYRLFQLNSPNGYLVLFTLAAACTAAWIDGTLAIGKSGSAFFWFTPETLAIFGVVSLFSKLVSAIAAFLLALWFKK